MMLSAEPLRELDWMTQGAYHRTNIELELSKNKMRSLPPIPRPKPVSGERIAPKNCSRIAILAFFEVGCVCGVTFAFKVVLLARNRVISSVRQLKLSEAAKLVWFRISAIDSPNPLSSFAFGVEYAVPGLVQIYGQGG